MRNRLAALLHAIGIIDAKPLADALFLLIDGAYASSQILGGRNGPAKSVAWAANALVDHSLGIEAKRI